MRNMRDPREAQNQRLSFVHTRTATALPPNKTYLMRQEIKRLFDPNFIGQHQHPYATAAVSNLHHSSDASGTDSLL